MAQTSEDLERDSQSDRGTPDETDHMADIPPSEMQILMRIQHIDGSPLPTKMIDKKCMIAFSNQYAGEQPHNVEILAPTEICYTYKENVILAIVAGRLNECYYMGWSTYH